MKRTHQLVGAAVLAAGTLVAGGIGTAVAAPVQAVAEAPRLDPGDIRYVEKSWHHLAPNDESSIRTEVPAGWRFVHLGRDHARFVGGRGVWNVRVDAGLAGKYTAAQSMDRRIDALERTPGFRVCPVGPAP